MNSGTCLLSSAGTCDCSFHYRLRKGFELVEYEQTGQEINTAAKPLQEATCIYLQVVSPLQ